MSPLPIGRPVHRLLPTWLLPAAILAASAAAAQEPAAGPAARPNEEAHKAPKTVAQALTQGKPSIQLRYRFETVSEDARPRDAYASTLRTALGYEIEYARQSHYADNPGRVDAGYRF